MNEVEGQAGPHRKPPADIDIPLVLDVDGTLLRTDLLYETFWGALGKCFAKTVFSVFSHWRKPARLKLALLDIYRPNVENLPVRIPVLDKAHEALAAGRMVHLVSGSCQSLVDELAQQLALPGPHFGSDTERNLTGSAKAAFLSEHFGSGQYDYVGNARADLESWSQARNVFAVAPSPSLKRKIDALSKPVETLYDGWSINDAIREMRPHQWVKNLLLFVPLIFAHSFNLASFLAVAIAFIAFSLGASSIYVLNDMLDLDADRSHPEKCNRPIAAGDLPIAAAMRLSFLLAGLAALLAFLVSTKVAVLMLAYMTGSLTYSLWLKKIRWVDLITLTGLFLLRVLTGAAAAQASVSPSLMAFCFAVFFTLACAKRLTALSRMKNRKHLPGRGYSWLDFEALKRAAYTSTTISGGFFVALIWNEHWSGHVSAPITATLAIVPLMLFLARMVRLGSLGREDYDPVRFALKDRVGLALAGIGAALFFLSY